jgi:hypothetical protein
MKNVLKIILEVLEYFSLFFVGYYGMKYTLVAGTIFFGRPAGIIIASVVIILFGFHILKKEGVIEP